MPVIVEDGSVVDGANSYITITEARTYATDRGYTLAPDGVEGDATVSAMVIKAGDYLNSLESRYIGTRVAGFAQFMSFPRTGVIIYDEDWPEDEIPSMLKNAQCQLCIEVFNGLELMISQTGGLPVIREKVGPLETQYSEAVLIRGVKLSASIPAVDALLAPLMKPVTGALRTVRV